MEKNRRKYTPLSIAVKNEKEINMDMLRMSEILAL
jgi:hypothetical protein